VDLLWQGLVGVRMSTVRIRSPRVHLMTLLERVDIKVNQRGYGDKVLRAIQYDMCIQSSK